MDWAEHGLDHLPGLSIGSDITTLDRLLDDDAVEGKALVPEATIRRGEPAVVRHLPRHGASHRRHFWAGCVRGGRPRKFQQILPQRAGVQSYSDARLWHRLVRRTAATRPMAKIFGVTQEPLDRFVYWLTGGATTASAWLADVKITMLTTTGAKTGQRRTVAVLGLPDGDDTIVIASNFGRPHNPAWYHNLRAHPNATVVVDGVRREVLARELSGSDRDRGYRRGEEIFPGFIHYRRWATNRQIPVVRLEPLALGLAKWAPLRWRA